MTRRLATLTAAAILSALAFAASAQASAHYPYTLIDLGTFGGPQADVGNGPYINAAGVVTGTADTMVSDPFGPNDSGAFNGDPYVQHTYVWRDGTLTDLGALGPDPTDDSSYPNGINARGDLAGLSDNGSIDPLTGSAETDAVLWHNGQIINLGTLGGDQSGANSLNDQDQVTGDAENTTLDPYSLIGATQAHAFLWQHGQMRDLGTLGGPDSIGWYINDRGQIAGNSYTNYTANSDSEVPTLDPFLWQHGHMIDLGTLGGDYGNVLAFNNNGEVIGFSYTAGDQTFLPFLWAGSRMIDLGTFGGDNGFANAINKQGDVVGAAQVPDENWNGFFSHDGKMVDLPPVGGAPWAFANGVNDRDQVVGNTTDDSGNSLNAVLWTGGSAYDLNGLAAPSALHLTDALWINDVGDIIGEGMLNGDMRNFLLIPNRSVPLPRASTGTRPLKSAGVRDESASAAFELTAARRGIKAGIHQPRLSLITR